MFKECRLCGDSYPLEKYQFIIKKTSQVCIRHICHKCIDKRNNDRKKEKMNNPIYRERTAERKRNNQLKSIYGIDRFEYTALLKSQDNKCKICGISNETSYHTPHYLYHISYTYYPDSLGVQYNKCKICGISNEEYGKTFHVDHCHNGGHVRGLLCHSCNTGIGHFRDNIETLKKAIEYLENDKLSSILD